MPATYDITTYNGATFNQQFIWRDSAGALVNTTRGQLRQQAVAFNAPPAAPDAPATPAAPKE